MPCFRPLQGYRSATVNPSGKRSIVFHVREGFTDLRVTFPCGQCIGCRLERSRQWAMRCVHEASLHEANCFITLTYDPKHLPTGGSLVVRDFQLFMKKLRKAYHGTRIRFFHCGEYGEKLGRPHYHAILFGFDFPDKKPAEKSQSGAPQWASESLTRIWGKGRCLIGTVTFDSAAYVARYITKKITGDAATAHYAGRLPEYTTMSRRPGIAKGWLDRWSSDAYPSDSIALRGRLMKPPKFYDRQFELANPDEFRKIKSKRRSGARALEDSPDNSSQRLRTRELVQELTLQKQLPRSYENGK